LYTLLNSQTEILCECLLKSEFKVKKNQSDCLSIMTNMLSHMQNKLLVDIIIIVV